ncbi:MAG: DinB family protein [Candidatus Latescibacteria bacterium]|nr:DinB family protein [Candidatus Latescibacterota bacterium]
MHVDTLKLQLGYAQHLLAASLADVTQAESLRRPEGGGNSINWLAGHLLDARNGVLKLLGAAPVMDEARLAPYRRGSTGQAEAAGALDLDSLRDALAASHAAIKAGLGAVPEERLREAAPFSPFGRDDETVGTLLAGVVFHECYHVGQVGILRRELGKPGIIR